MSKKTKKAKKNAAAANAANTANMPGLFGNFGTWLNEHPSEQFLLGAALGAAAVYIFSHEELRTKIMKGGIDLYTAIAGGLAELREQAADLKAEAEIGKASHISA